MHRIAIIIGSLVLTACTQAQLNVIDQLAQNDTGHTLPALDNPSEASSSEVVSVEVSSSVEIVSSSSAEPLPPCVPLFRVLSCGPDGEYEWW